MPELEVPGAIIRYEVHGKGPLLLCISGANGSFNIWQPLTQQLKDKFTVASYDRRGFSRSFITGPQEYDRRLDTDADDAAALIKHLSSDKPAVVLGSSSGAIVSLNLLLRHPDLVKLLIPHEPPLVHFNANARELMDGLKSTYNTYRRSGPFHAMNGFFELCKVSEGEKAAFTTMAFDFKENPYLFSNLQYWFEREFLVYPLAEYTFDMFKPYKQKLLPVNSQLTANDALPYVANANFAKEVGFGEIKEMAGGHVGFGTHPETFARDLEEILAEESLI